MLGFLLLTTFLHICATYESGTKSDKIKHVIVLMMENRSFDHLLGFLKTDKDSRINGLERVNRPQPRDINDPSKGYVSITRDGFDIAPDDPKHDFDNIAIQINSDKMNGFVYDSILNGLNETNSVSMFDHTSAPIINQLAMEYAVFDDWFCSIPGPTDPNRLFAMAGTSLGIIDNYNGTLYEQQSYFDYLVQNDRTFSGYYQNDLWMLGYFKDLLKPENFENIHDLDSHFYDDLKAGNINDFVWLQPRMTTTVTGDIPTWQHPDASVLEGERLIKKLYEAIRASPIWEDTLFIITYDENGGFYDHVAPPAAVPPDNYVAENGFKFDKLGVRIPTIAISPWIDRNTVVSSSLPNEKPTETSQYDSTSIIATANILLGVTAPPLSDRMGWANTFATLVNRNEIRHDCPMTLVDLPEISQEMRLQMAKEQRARPINEHMNSQMLFFCHQNYANNLENCPGMALGNNQGEFSDWIRAEHVIFEAKLTKSLSSLPLHTTL